MEEQSLKPIIKKLEKLFSAFNEKFYNGKLQTPVIVIKTTTPRSVYGSVVTPFKTWKKTSSDDNETEYYEINFYAEHLSKSFKELCSKLLHEMVHLWNLQNDVQDTSRGGTYHNKKFKLEAVEHGLLVEYQQKYGWALTQLNEDAEQFIEQMNDTSFDLYRDSAARIKKKSKQSSRKYECPCCRCIIRATKEVHVVCGICKIDFKEIL